jgi:hypothetical protein
MPPAYYFDSIEWFGLRFVQNSFEIQIKFEFESK